MDNIIVTRENQIAILTMNRPGCKNALDGHTYDEFALAVAEVQNDTQTRVLVITGVTELGLLRVHQALLFHLKNSLQSI